MQETGHAGTDDRLSLSWRVVEAVAERERVDPIDLEPPLADVLDPGALDSLFAPTVGGTTREGGRVTFPYRGYDVTVHGDGRVVLDG